MTEFNENPQQGEDNDMNVLEVIFIQFFMALTKIPLQIRENQEQLQELLTRVSDENGNEETLRDDWPSVE